MHEEPSANKVQYGTRELGNDGMRNAIQTTGKALHGLKCFRDLFEIKHTIFFLFLYISLAIHRDFRNWHQIFCNRSGSDQYWYIIKSPQSQISRARLFKAYLLERILISVL